MELDMLRPLLLACLVLLGIHSLENAFAQAPPKSRGSPAAVPRNSQAIDGLRLPAIASSSAGAHPKRHRQATSSLCGTAATAAALVLTGLAVRAHGVRRQRAAAVRRNAFSSSGSGFMGTPTITSFVVSEGPPAEPALIEGYCGRSGVAGMGMKAQVWWIQNNGFDGRSGKIFDSRARESRRRGEDLFRHDVDTFELTLSNLKGAPGAKPKKVIRGRGAYGSHGRTCGFGNGGAGKRGRRTINPGYEGGHQPIQRWTPKLSRDQLDSMKQDPYTPVTLRTLNMCDDGDEVTYQDLFIRGYPVKWINKRMWDNSKFDKIKIKGQETDTFEVKNLTVYAHAFEPAAREKIENNGGRCIRLHEWANIPLDANAIKTLVESKEAGEGEEGEEVRSVIHAKK